MPTPMASRYRNGSKIEYIAMVHGLPPRGPAVAQHQEVRAAQRGTTDGTAVSGALFFRFSSMSPLRRACGGGR